MRIALCTRNPSNPVIRVLAEALESDGMRADVIDDPRMVLQRHSRYDAGFWRPDARDAQVAAYSRQAVLLLEARRTPFLNALSSMERSASKIVSGGLFAGVSLPVPEWWVAPRQGTTDSAIPAGPKIVKPVWGSRSRGVAWCADVDAALVHARELGAPCVLQRPIAWRRQLRCVVAPDGPVRVFEQANPEPGRPTIVRFDRSHLRVIDSPPDGLAPLANSMLAAVGGDLMRADVLEDLEGRLWALEINASFGFPHDDLLILGAFKAGFRRVAAAGDNSRPF